MTIIKHLKNTDYVDKIIEMKDILTEIDETNIKNTVEKLFETVFIKDSDGIYSIIENISTLVQIRPYVTDIIGEFCMAFIKNSHFDSPAGSFGKILLEYLLRPVADQNYISKVPHYLILRSCVQQEIFTDNDYIPSMNELFKNSFYNQFTLMFFVFLEFIEAENNEFYTSVLPILLNLAQNRHIHEKLAKLLQNIDDYRREDYLLLRSVVSSREDLQILSIIQNDNEKGLERLNIDPNYRISFSIFQPIQLLQNSPTLIQIAAFYGSLKCFNKLHELGAKLHRKDSVGWNVSAYAVSSGNYEILSELDKVNISFEKTLQFAAIFRRYETFDWILSRRSKDIEDINKELRNVLCVCARNNNFRTFMNILERGSQSIRHRDRKGENSLLASATGGYLSFVKFILQFDNVELNCFDNSEKTSAHIASYNGNTALVSYLLHKGSSFTSKDNEGATPLHLAAEFGHHRVIKIIGNSVDVNSKDNLGRTPLHLACDSNFPAAVEALIKLGANKYAKDRDGKTPDMLTNDEVIREMFV